MIQCLRDSLGWPLVNSYSEDVLQIPLDNYLDVCEGENLNNKELINALLQDKEDCVCGYGGLKVGELRSREAPSVLRLDTLGHICNNSRFQEGKVITLSLIIIASIILQSHLIPPAHWLITIFRHSLQLSFSRVLVWQEQLSMHSRTSQAGVNILAFQLLT